jgi:hypothetical protein
VTGTHLDYDAIRTDTVVQVAKLMAAAAITAPKSGGQLFLAGKHNFLETIIVEDPASRGELAGWLRARGKERREQIWFRDAEVAEAVDAILFVGLAPDWYPPNYDCCATDSGSQKLDAQRSYHGGIRHDLNLGDRVTDHVERENGPRPPSGRPDRSRRVLNERQPGRQGLPDQDLGHGASTPHLGCQQCRPPVAVGRGRLHRGAVGP